MHAALSQWDLSLIKSDTNVQIMAIIYRPIPPKMMARLNVLFLKLMNLSEWWIFKLFCICIFHSTFASIWPFSELIRMCLYIIIFRIWIYSFPAAIAIHRSSQKVIANRSVVYCTFRQHWCIITGGWCNLSEAELTCYSFWNPFPQLNFTLRQLFSYLSKVNFQLFL